MKGLPISLRAMIIFMYLKTYEEALGYSQANKGREVPVALVVQEEYIDESEPGNFLHVKEERITEWPVEFLRRQKERQTQFLISCRRTLHLIGWIFYAALFSIPTS